jgi:hypothetical protein
MAASLRRRLGGMPRFGRDKAPVYPIFGPIEHAFFRGLAMAETTTTSSSPYSIGRVIDYILGRNTLIGIASFMLLIISGYATWHGMRDFIIGVSATANQNQQLPGGMSFSNDFLVIAVVVRAHLPDVAHPA